MTSLDGCIKTRAALAGSDSEGSQRREQQQKQPRSVQQLLRRAGNAGPAGLNDDVSCPLTGL